MNNCLLLILSFLSGWYICNRYHERDRLVEGMDGATIAGYGIGAFVVWGFFALAFPGKKR